MRRVRVRGLLALLGLLAVLSPAVPYGYERSLSAAHGAEATVLIAGLDQPATLSHGHRAYSHPEPTSVVAVLPAAAGPRRPAGVPDRSQMNGLRPGAERAGLPLTRAPPGIASMTWSRGSTS